MNGRQLADAIQQQRPELKVLYTSGYTENAIIHHGRLDSGVLLLAKPYRKSDLARMIRRRSTLDASGPLRGTGRSSRLSFKSAAFRPGDQEARCCAVITMRTRSAAFRAPSFFMMLAR